MALRAQRARVLPSSPIVSDTRRVLRHFRLDPELATQPITHRWGGQVAITRDRLPRLFAIGSAWLKLHDALEHPQTMASTR